jgi:hypothetical protein
MSEREIRNIVRSICNDLDERARRAAQSRIKKVVLPAALGVTLAVAGCSSDSSANKGNLNNVDGSAVVDSAAGKDAANTAPEGTAGTAGSTSGTAGDIAPTAVAIYGVQIAGSGATGGSGPVTPPDASADGGTGTDAGPAVDSGTFLPYMAPIVDSGAVLEYMAPLPDSGIMVTLYAASAPDATIFPGK